MVYDGVVGVELSDSTGEGMAKPGKDQWGDDDPSLYEGEANKDKKGQLGGSVCRHCKMMDGMHSKDCPKNN